MQRFKQQKLQAHQCPARNKQQLQKQTQPERSAATQVPEKQQPVVSDDLSKEVAAIKAQLLVLASRLDRIEHELQN